MTLDAPIPGAPSRELAAAAALAPHAEGEGHLLSSLTDEEILALTGDGIGFDLPWVQARESRAEGFSRGEARLTARRSLIARGLLAPELAMAALEQREPTGDAGAWTPNLLLTGIVARRALVPLQVRLDGPTVDRVSIVSLFVDHDGTVLQELVSPDGIHHFRISGTPAAAGVLRERLDPQGAADASPPTPVVTGTLAELEASAELGPVLASARFRTRVRSNDRRDGSSLSLLVAAADLGVVVLQEAAVDGASQAAGPDPLLEGTMATAAQLEELALSLLSLEPAG